MNFLQSNKTKNSLGKSLASRSVKATSSTGKRFSSYIGIVFLIIGFFAPLQFAHAEQGLCVLKSHGADGSTLDQRIDMDRSQCVSTTPNDAGGYQEFVSFTPYSSTNPAPAAPVNESTLTPSESSNTCGLTNIPQCGTAILQLVFEGILKLMAWLLWFSGYLLNFVLKHTVLGLSDSIKHLTGINIAWKVIRDLMNIAFIWLLLYEAIKLIIGLSDTGKIKTFITGIVMASILINFSLFFTKLLIDASNVVTVGFYNGIIGSSPVSEDYGLANPIVRSLGLTTLYDGSAPPDFGAGKGLGGILIMGLGSGILILIASFVLFAIAILFIVRYIVLVILLMLSPIGYMGMALPAMKTYQGQWWETLKGQLLFAPTYMIMTWVILTLMSSDGFIATGKFTDILNSGSKPPIGAMALAFNFVVIIGLLILSMTTAKKTATQGSALIGQLTGKLTAFAGGAIIGGAAAGLRNTIGAGGRALADNAKLQQSAANGNTASRLALYASRKARSSTFDVRNTTVPTSALGDLIQGTVGRTTAGKALGLNDVNIPNIAVAAPIAAMAGVGAGGTKGYKELKEEGNKRVSDREAANANELTLATAKQAVLDGAKADPATPAGVTAIDEMEKALAKLSDKQLETLVAGNRDLLESQNFANKISVKQLEAINKSDQFSDADKTELKNKRFKEIETISDPAALAKYTAALAIPVAARTPDQTADIKRMEDARGRVKGLSDSELEMVDGKYLDSTRPEGKEFIAQLRVPQAEAIGKSSKFTATQKNAVKTERMRPLLESLTPGPAYNPTTAQTIFKKADLKTMVSYVKTSAGPGQPNIALHKDIIPVYTVKTLQRMAAHENMTDADIHDLRMAILGGGVFGAPGADPATVTWLTSGAGVTEFP